MKDLYYRRNRLWGQLHFSTNNFNYLKEELNDKLKEVREEANEDFIVDIVDIKENLAYNSKLKANEFFISVYYALTKKEV